MNRFLPLAILMLSASVLSGCYGYPYHNRSGHYYHDDYYYDDRPIFNNYYYEHDGRRAPWPRSQPGHGPAYRPGHEPDRRPDYRPGHGSDRRPDYRPVGQSGFKPPKKPGGQSGVKSGPKPGGKSKIRYVSPNDPPREGPVVGRSKKKSGWPSHVQSNTPRKPRSDNEEYIPHKSGTDNRHDVHRSGRQRGF